MAPGTDIYLHNRNEQELGKRDGQASNKVLALPILLLWLPAFLYVTTVYPPLLSVPVLSLGVSNLYCNGTLNLLPHLTSPVTILLSSRRKLLPSTSWFSSLLPQRWHEPRRGGQKPLKEVLCWDLKSKSYNCNVKNLELEPVVDKAF